MTSKIVSFTLNGRETEAMVKPLTTLQKLLREQFGLTATKTGCKQGGCGSCTVLVNGRPAAACTQPSRGIRRSPSMSIIRLDWSMSENRYRVGACSG